MPGPIGERDESAWNRWTTPDTSVAQKHDNRGPSSDRKVDESSLGHLVESLPQRALSLAPSAFANPALTGARSPGPQDLSRIRTWVPVESVGHGHCEKPRPVAYPGQAGKVAEAGIGLEASLENAAMTSTGDLARYIDEYTAYTATRPQLKALHDQAVSTGPMIFANRLELDEKELHDARMHEHVEDQTRNLQVQPPLPVQLRASVGEVAIPIAQTADLVAQFVPVVGQVLAAAEVATGRSMGGLGPELDGGGRALNAALLLAPVAVKLLGSGLEGAAAIVRIARLSGRSTQEVRSVLNAAVEVQQKRTLIERAVAATGTSARPAVQPAVTRETAAVTRRVAVDEGETLARGRYKPTVTGTPALKAGTGRTNKYGDVTYSTNGTAKDVALVQAHEAVHSFLSPKALNGLREFRADVRMSAYKKSQLCRYIEEALAESHAQLQVNGPRSLPTGIAFPVKEGYVNLWPGKIPRTDRSGIGVVAEAAIGTVIYGGVVYGAYLVVDHK